MHASCEQSVQRYEERKLALTMACYLDSVLAAAAVAAACDEKEKKKKSQVAQEKLTL